jgi:UDP-arabinose 4-epimerase
VADPGADILKTILVTGGAGYVGSHCCKAFANAGWRVVVFDNLFRGWRDMVKWGPLIEGDILDRSALDAAFAEVKPDVVAHFAALTYVGESVDDPGLYYRNNTLGAFNLLEAMRAVGANKLIFSSTAATYGVPQETPIPEDHPQLPINPYGWSKLFVERMLADYAAAYDLRYAALRYFNAAGADAEGEVGERHEPETHVIPLAARGALRDDYVFTIFGDDFETRDGTCVRDYVHVSDLGRAHAAAADYLLGGGAAMAFNLGTGHGTTVKEVADAIEAVSGRALPRRIGPRRAGDPAVLVASNTRAKAVLGWAPQQSSIDEIVQSAWSWAKKDDAKDE